MPEKSLDLLDPTQAESFQTPGNFEEHRVAISGGQVTRVPFLLVRFLWASKENEQINQKFDK
jgi:hypothetical protein